MYQTEYRYSLAKGSRKMECPQCGRQRCFKPYIDNESGQVLHPTVGRCDHEQSCQYHYTPKDFFNDYPDARDERMTERNSIKTAVKKMATIPLETTQTLFFDLAWAEASVWGESTFREWFLGLPFDKMLMEQVLMDYYVGATTEDVVVEGRNCGKGVIFWLIDEQQRVHDAKLMAYQPDGHRVQGWGNSMRALCKKKGIGPQLDSTDKVLFGLHLLNKYPSLPVALVESEKTALVCACRYPQYLWMATGGCGGLNSDKLRPLMNRRLVVWPDAGEYEKWKQKMQQSGHRDYVVMDFMEKYESNMDIADILINNLKNKEEKQ